MARTDGIPPERASTIIRLFYWAVQRKAGRVSDMWQIAAHVPSLLWARGLFEILLDRSNLEYSFLVFNDSVRVFEAGV